MSLKNNNIESSEVLDAYINDDIDIQSNDNFNDNFSNNDTYNTPDMNIFSFFTNLGPDFSVDESTISGIVDLIKSTMDTSQEMFNDLSQELQDKLDENFNISNIKNEEDPNNIEVDYKIDLAPHPIRGSLWSLTPSTNLSNFEISLYSLSDLSDAKYTTFSNKDGSFAFQNIALDKYLLKVELSNDFCFATKNSDSLINNKTLLSDIIYNDNDDIFIPIGVQKKHRIHGFVYFEYSDNIPRPNKTEGLLNLKVTIVDSNNKSLYATQTGKFLDNNGYFEFNNLPPDSYKLIFSTPKQVKIFNANHGVILSKNSIMTTITNENIDASVLFKLSPT